MPVISGTVEYEQRVNTGDYQHKACKVVLTVEGQVNADHVLHAKNLVRGGLEIGSLPPEKKPTLAEKVKGTRPDDVQIVDTPPSQVDAKVAEIKADVIGSKDAEKPTEVTNDQLVAAAQSKAKLLGHGAQIQVLIEKMGAKTLTTLPQEKRLDFLTELTKLQKA